MSTRSNLKKKPVSKKKPNQQQKSILTTLTHKYKSSEAYKETQDNGASLYDLMIDELKNAIEKEGCPFCKRAIDDFFEASVDEAMNKLNNDGFFSFCYGDFLVVGLNPAETYNWTREL